MISILAAGSLSFDHSMRRRTIVHASFRHKRAIAIGLVVCVIPLTGCARSVASAAAPADVRERIERQIPAAGIALLHVDTKVGRIEVTSGASREFSVTAEKRYE